MARLLIDQQLPSALAKYFTELGHDAKHVKEYPGGTTLADAEIVSTTQDETRIVVTKDDDFLVTHLLLKKPARLVHVTCGNIATRDLLALFDKHHALFEEALISYDYIEIDRLAVIIRDPT